MRVCYNTGVRRTSAQARGRTAVLQRNPSQEITDLKHDVRSWRICEYIFGIIVIIVTRDRPFWPDNISYSDLKTEGVALKAPRQVYL